MALYPYNQLLIGELLNNAVHKAKDRVAFKCEEKQHTYGELNKVAKQLAGWLQNNGIAKEDKVAFLMKNSIEFIEIFYAIALSGGVGVPLNFRLGPKEVQYIVDNCDAKIMFIQEEYKEMLLSIKDELPKLEKIIIIKDEQNDDAFMTYSAIFEEKVDYNRVDTLTDDDPVMIIYTSGTTGLPKGAVLTNKNLFMNAFNIIWEGKEEAFQRSMITVPIFHIGGITITVKTPLLVGTTIIQKEFNPVKTLETIEREKLEVIGFVPTMWEQIMRLDTIGNYDLTSVKRATSGGSILTVEMKEKILKYFPNTKLIDTFGQTETSQSTTYLFGDDVLRKPNSVGKPVLNVLVKIVDDDMNEVPVGEVGEIVYRGPTVMKEYYKNPEATEEAFKGGWFHSGDLVKMDEEGYIYVVDRKKNMIISGGENIYPAEVERVINMMPEVLESAIVGVPHEKWGETVKAVIVLNAGATLTEDQVIEHCKENLASYKKPTIVEFVDELPRNATGKVLKYVLQQQ